MSNLISVCNYSEHYVQLIDSNIDESFLQNQFYFYTIDKTCRAIIGDDQGNLICRINLSGLKQKLVEDIVIKQENSIFTYKIFINFYNPSYSSYSTVKRINFHLEILLDVSKLNKKLEKKPYDLLTLDSLLTNKVSSLIKFNTEFWKKESVLKSNDNLSQPDTLQVQLFQYQLKTLQWMVNLEKKLPMVMS